MIGVEIKINTTIYIRYESGNKYGFENVIKE